MRNAFKIANIFIKIVKKEPGAIYKEQRTGSKEQSKSEGWKLRLKLLA